MAGKAVPERVFGLTPAGELVHPLTQVPAEFRIAHTAVALADNQKLLRQPPVQKQVIDRGHQFAPGQVAAGPEDPNRGVTKLIAKIAKCPSQKSYAGLRCRVEALAWLPTSFSNAYWQADEYMAMLPKSVKAREIIMARAAREKAMETGSPRVAGVGEGYDALRRKMWDEARSGALKMPVLLVAGKDDVLDWGAHDATAHLRGELGLYDIIGAKNTRVQMDVINDGGHFMYREHPLLFNNDLIHFIEFWEQHPAAKMGM